MVSGASRSRVGSGRVGSTVPHGPTTPAGTMTRMRTIALEEHFLTPELAAPPGTGPLASWGPQIGDQLRDLGQERLANMDATGIDLQVISHVAPAAQGMAGAEGVTRAREANDRLAGAVAAHPDRFGGFATLPTADPAAAADELERAVTRLGLAGAMVHSTLGSNDAFLDEPSFAPLLERFERLDVPLYLHPAPPSAALREALYRGCPPPWRAAWPPGPGAGTPRPACTCCG